MSAAPYNLHPVENPELSQNGVVDDGCIDALTLMEFGQLDDVATPSFLLHFPDEVDTLVSFMESWESSNDGEPESKRHRRHSKPKVEDFGTIPQNLMTFSDISSIDDSMAKSKISDCTHEEKEKDNLTDVCKPIFQKEIINISDIPQIRADALPGYPKTKDERAFILSTMMDIFLLSNLRSSEKELFVNLMQRKLFPKGSEIIRQGSSGDFFYIIYDGRVSYLINGERNGGASVGSCFGELSLMHGHPRSATVLADVECTLWSLGRIEFRTMIALTDSSATEELVASLRGVVLLQNMADEDIHKLALVTKTISVDQGCSIVKKGSVGSVFYMIKQGNVMCSDLPNNSITYMKSGEYFGERSLLTGASRSCTVTSIEPCILFTLEKNDFHDLLGSYESTMNQNHLMRVISIIPLFKKLRESERSALVSMMKTVTFKHGDYIIKQGEEGDSFYVIVNGSAKVLFKKKDEISAKTLKMLGPGNFFGEMALLKRQPRTCSVLSNSTSPDVPCECLVLDAVAFNRVIGSARGFSMINNAMEENIQQSEATSKSGINQCEIPLSRLKIVKEISRGSFGRVDLVQDTENYNVYALKAVSYKSITNVKKQMCVLNEKASLLLCDHPFITKLHSTYKDKESLYFLLEYCPGGEFTPLMRNPKACIPLQCVKFYTACLCLALEHMSWKFLAHRDLKPENIVIDMLGYIKLIDFGLSKVIRKRSYTVCGTPEFLAPEMILGKGHNHGVDHWALGVLIFEIISGSLLYEAKKCLCITDVYKSIINDTVEFPDGFDLDAKTLIQKLLVKDPVRRLGMTKGGFKAIWKEKFLVGTDLEQFLKKQIKAPWRPELSSLIDTKYFEKKQQIFKAEEDATDSFISKTDGWADIF
mmetsp:Transcript_12321/g.24548  ORF Transcript_12321/g.24548 Transcript_12321/m.24548 type:complete len:876 (+) Transcript_12321:124-2751(+)